MNYYAATVKDFIAHYRDYLSVNMDAEVVVQLMISQELISEDIVMTAQSSYHKNCLILERLQYTDVQTLVSFCEMLKANNSQRTIGETLLNGKYKLHKLYDINYVGPPINAYILYFQH